MAFFSTHLADLPPLSTEVEQHAQLVESSLRRLIEANQGFMRFSQYMRHVLYEPGLGYYSAGSMKLGSEGDFITAPLLTPYFSYTLARYMQAEQMTQGSILELGAGSGVMAVDIMRYLSESAWLPESYLILEPSADLRDRQAGYIRQQIPELFNRFRWLDSLPEENSFEGSIIANEVIDAIPVERFTIIDNRVQLLGVRYEEGCLAWGYQEAEPEFAKAVRSRLPYDLEAYPEGYCSEINLLLDEWLLALSNCLKEGRVTLLDYGYERMNYYQPQRADGTLRAYYRHYAVDDVLTFPGLMDVTAWVDFTAVAEAADRANLDVAGYTTQANFMMENGLLELFEATGNDAAVESEYLSNVEAIKRIVEPGEMGETVKVITLARDCAPGPGFSRDMRYRL